jgi:hypothetical protein
VPVLHAPVVDVIPREQKSGWPLIRSLAGDADGLEQVPTAQRLPEQRDWR